MFDGFLVAGTSPDDYTEDFSEHRIQCESCTRWLQVSECNFYYLEILCARCLRDKSIILVKPQPKNSVTIDGWQI